MNINKSRSSLKKVSVLENEETDPAKSIKRRISFSGKKFIREFNATEIPRDYNNSYEISEHNNDSSGPAYATAAGMDKENTPLVNVSGTPTYDRTDFSFRLQTSINVTLMPHEMDTHHQSMESPGPVDITSRCSLSISDVACAKLRENSIYNIPVAEKTVDLMSTKMDFGDIEPTIANRKKDQKLVEKQSNSCKTRQADAKQKTMFFNDDITCDFDNIEPLEMVTSPAIVISKPDHEKEPLVIGEGEYMSFLQDDSTMSSPLIPLDVISENGISKKLNFRQLNDALNSGRIQVFPKGPRTPTTDRKCKQQRFWEGSEQPRMEQDVTPKNTIKRRGTLNFDESMLISPIAQPQKSFLMEDKSDKSSADLKRNYRFSQADELMLDNTNFLVNAKVGDETQSRNSSKCYSRRETTYDNTAMEWEDLEKREAAVAAALEQVRRRQTIHNIEAIDEEGGLTVPKNIKSDVLSNDVENQINFENEIFKEREKSPKSETHIIEAINITETTPYNHKDHRQTVQGSQQIKEAKNTQNSKLQPQRTSPEMEKTLHYAEPIEVDITNAQEQILQPPATAVIQKSSSRRQTLHLCDSIEEESFKSSVSTVLPKVLQNSDERELDLLEPSSKKSESQPHGSKRRQNPPKSGPLASHQNKGTIFLMSEEIEEDILKANTDFNVTKTPLNMHRQTLLTPQLIEEDIVSVKAETLINNSDNCRRRQTIHMAEPIEEDFACNQEKLHPQLSGPLASHRNKRGTTFLMSEEIEDDILDANTDFKVTKKPLNMHRQTLLTPQLLEEDIVSVKTDTSIHNPNSCKRRQTMHMSDSIEEYVAWNHQELLPPPPDPMASYRNQKIATFLMSEAIEEDVIHANEDFKKSNKPLNMHRQTILTPQLIEEDIVSVKSETSVNNSDNCRHRQTIHMAEPIDEDFAYNQEKLHPQTSGPLASHRNTKRTTILISEEIEEDLLDVNKDVKVIKKPLNMNRQTLLMPQVIEEDIVSVKTDTSIHNPNYCRRRQTIHMAEPIDEDFACNQAELFPTTSGPKAANQNKKRATFLRSEAVEEDLPDPNNEFKVARKSKNNNAHTLPTAQVIEEDIVSVETEAAMHNLNSLHKSKLTDEYICSGPSVKEQNINHRQTLIKSDPIEEDTSCVDFIALSSVTQQLSKPRQTLHLVEAVDEDIVLTPSMPDSPSSYKLNESPIQDSSCELKQQLSQIRTKTREATVASASIKMDYPDDGQSSSINQLSNKSEYASPCRKTRQTFESKIQTILETPKNNKSQSLRQNYFPITPGLSMIEYEEEEERCEGKSTTPTSSHTIYQSLDMDISCYDSPVALSKQASSFNIKRLPIHLTPNMPNSKKRNVHVPANRQMEDLNTFQINIDTPIEDKSRLDPKAGNRSRIPIKTKSINQNSLSEQLDGTVQIVRCQLIRPPINQFSVEGDAPDGNKITKDFCLYEANPITISDVSNHFLAQRDLAKHSLDNTTEQPRDTSFDSRNSNEHSKRNHKKFINLSGDTEIFAAAEMTDEDEIEKIKQSLVSTLLDEDDYEIQFQDYVAPTENRTETCLEQLNSPIAGAVASCKKCKHCKLSIDSDATLNAFVISDWNELQLGLERLQRMRQRPHIKDVERYWNLKISQFESNCNNETTNDTSETENDLRQSEPLTLPQMLDMFNKKMKEHNVRLPKPEPTKTFVRRLDALLLAELPNWIFDYQLQCENTFIFTHRKISTFQLILIYEPVDCLEAEIRVHRIRADTMPTIPKTLWTVHEHLMDFQLRLKLPLNIIDFLEGNDVESFFKFLKQMDNLCLETWILCTNLHLSLISLESRLLREPNRNVVRKIVRKTYQAEDELYTRLERIEFLINIGNVEEISFKDILQPPLYMFDEKIQFLPKGIEFLNAFLQQPEQYLKIEN